MPPRIFSPLSNLQSSLHLCRSKSFHRHCPRRRCLTLLQCCTTCVLHCCSLLKPRAHSVSLCHATPTNAVPDGTVTFFFFGFEDQHSFGLGDDEKSSCRCMQCHALLRLVTAESRRWVPSQKSNKPKKFIAIATSFVVF